ncbi:(2Fe-2S)-binding protein [Methylogaea oryzae]|uniref:Bacterioferritin-associated ferredoxin n=1 Tax=Methylogaea oryzae TaxID=1295382 RepID=A0A8D4VS50_9GAMM|nr:(2Fe-2S)-binding protein [Methylogaea oryzae]BBL72294.1 bacterioferritin-associated ferredoxin [Methylogaea oryzae]
MYVCICKKVTDSQIRHAVLDGRVSHLRHLRQECGACSDCGLCSREAGKIIQEALKETALLDACLPAA